MIHNLLDGKMLILASASPRRKIIFEMIGLNALIVPASISEKHIYNNPIKLVKYHASEKTEAVSSSFDQNCLIVGADTIVFQNGRILGKPQDKLNAAQYLSDLSGRTHYVYTGVAISYKQRLIIDYSRSKVEFKQLSAREIEEYIKTGEPLDKAGAYGIQGYGSQFIKRISGCYYNVMGFPVFLFYDMLKRLL